MKDTQDLKIQVWFVGNGIIKFGLSIFIAIITCTGVPFANADIFVLFSRNLGVGDIGADVLTLQKLLNSDPDTRVAVSGPGSAGLETRFFGLLTKMAINKFQKKYASEILAVGQLPTGYVGPKTLKKLNRVTGAGAAVVNQGEAQQPSPSVQSPPLKVSVAPPRIPVPTIISVYPSRVRRGDVVTVVGTNFLPTGNSIALIDGPIYKSFDNLSSFDGKVITFVFNPPEIKTMSESEIRALPSYAVQQIEQPIKAAGKTLTDALSPYQQFNNESELRASLQRNGHSFDELYNYYFVTVENAGGKAVSQTALLYGLRNLPVPGLAIAATGHTPPLSSLGQYLGKFLAPFFPAVYAQGQYEGGTNTGIIMICTCGDGYLTAMTSYEGGGSGLYWFSWGFQANAGAGFIPPNQLGGYQDMSATCSIYAGEDCVDISANQAKKPWGTNLF